MLHFDTDDTAELTFASSHATILEALRQRIPTITPQIWQSSTHVFMRFSSPLNALIGEEVLEDFSLLDWLQDISVQDVSGQDAAAAHKIYWRNRMETYETAGYGIAHIIQGSSTNISSLLRLVHDATAEATPNIRYYGGTRFYAPSKADAVWQNFPDAAFVLPFLECDSAEDVVFLHCTVAMPLGSSLEAAYSKAEQKLRALEQSRNNAIKPDFTPYFNAIPYKSRTNVPSKVQWERSIDAALKEFSRERLEKVVLARRATVECTENIDSITLLRERLRKAPRATAFLLQFGTDSAFFGTTPELLYQREGRTISTEAIAGTRRRSTNDREDEAIADELLNSDKDRREHASVQRFIASALDELTESFTIGTVDILKLSNVQHLYAVFTGKLRATSDDAHILEHLHPTPAVGGTPRRKAVEFLQKHEGFDRGWYAAPVGWVNAHGAEFVVAIRSALITGNTAHLFSGAGIVAGSEAEKEWQEIEIKIAPLLELFQG
ncbi:MAG: isochorismate synthase [Candidatus Kapabacteria bacterium]|jgi:menaquinone-specific isochorismate synthase|nr:isochorismate synthase [Candidatus Kapabacteria bacterium]